MKNILGVLIFILFISFGKILSAEIEINEEDVRKGMVLQINDDFIFLKDNYQPHQIIQLDQDNLVKVVQGKKIPGGNITIPLEIRDTELARGLTFEVKTKEGERQLNIPKRKVFVPHRFYLVYPGLGEKGRYGGKDGALILEIYPKLSYALQVDISDTADDGLVVKFKYEDLFQGKMFDVLNELDKRDINIFSEFKYDKRRKFELHSEGLLDKRTPRKVGLLTRQPLLNRVDGELRLDNFKDNKRVSVGGNLIYTRGNKEFTFGNVSSVVQDFLHLQAKITEKQGNIILRLEDFSAYQQNNFKMRGFTTKRLGGQINLWDESNDLRFTLGNLIIGLEDNPLFGQVDDKLNFSLDYLETIGTYYAPLDMKKPSLGAVGNVKILGEGKVSWIRGKLNLRYNIDPSGYIQYNLSDDFITLWGSRVHTPWQNRSLIFIRHRKLFEDKTLLGKLNLEYIFSEVAWKRTNYATSFHSTQKIKYGLGKTFEILQIPLPLEFFIDVDTKKTYKYGITLSFRSFLN